MAEPRVDPVYEIRVRGVLGSTLLGAFPALNGLARGGETVLTGELPDQAALHGVLDQIESLGLELIAVNQVAVRLHEPCDLELPDPMRGWRRER